MGLVASLDFACYVCPVYSDGSVSFAPIVVSAQAKGEVFSIAVLFLAYGGSLGHGSFVRSSSFPYGVMIDAIPFGLMGFLAVLHFAFVSFHCALPVLFHLR